MGFFRDLVGPSWEFRVWGFRLRGIVAMSQFGLIRDYISAISNSGLQVFELRGKLTQEFRLRLYIRGSTSRIRFWSSGHIMGTIISASYEIFSFKSWGFEV